MNATRTKPDSAAPNALGRYLRSRLKERGISLSQLAKRTGLSRQTIHAAGSAGGRRLPNLETVIRIAIDLGVHPMQLMHLVLDDYNLPPRSSLPHARRGDCSVFLLDVTIPDGTVVAPCARITKTWALQNVGTVTWEDRSLRCIDDEAVVERRAHHQGVEYAVPTERLRPVTRVIEVPRTEPGDVVTLSVDFIAPSLPCTCVSYWKSFYPDGSPCFPESAGLTCTVRVLSMRAASSEASAYIKHSQVPPLRS